MEISPVLAFIVGVALLAIFLKIISFPIKTIIRLVINAIIGGVLLYIIDMFGASIGFTLDITWWSALLVGIAGIPGVILVAIIQFFIL